MCLYGFSYSFCVGHIVCWKSGNIRPINNTLDRMMAFYSLNSNTKYHKAKRVARPEEAQTSLSNTMAAVARLGLYACCVSKVE